MNVSDHLPKIVSSLPAKMMRFKLRKRMTIKNLVKRFIGAVADECSAIGTAIKPGTIRALLSVERCSIKRVIKLQINVRRQNLELYINYEAMTGKYKAYRIVERKCSPKQQPMKC